MADSNGVVQRPTNFQGNFGQDSAWTVRASFANLATQVDAVSTVTLTNSRGSVSIAATNTVALAAMRLISAVNARGPAGTGTVFSTTGNIAYVQLDATPRASGLLRVVLGNFSSVSTNIAAYPTNRAIGFELSSVPGTETNRVRLIAHNGTNSTNGPFVNIGDVFQRYVVGVKQTRGSESLQLLVGVNGASPAINTNATINGAPLVNAPGGHDAFDFGITTSTTNNGAVGATVYSAWVEVTD